MELSRLLLFIRNINIFLSLPIPKLPLLFNHKQTHLLYNIVANFMQRMCQCEKENFEYRARRGYDYQRAVGRYGFGIRRRGR